MKYSLFKTLRVNPEKGGLFTRGMWITAIITTRCNLHCQYPCPMFLDGRSAAIYDECSAQEWIGYFKNLKEWVSEVCFSGGEPSIHPGLGEMVNFLTKRGTHVRIYTNLFKIENILKCDPTFKLNILATYHHGDDKDQWYRSYQELKQRRYFVTASEIETPKVFDFTEYKGKYSASFIKSFNSFHAAPDSPKTGTLFIGCEPIYRGGKNR